jgi:hypothetical protein
LEDSASGRGTAETFEAEAFFFAPGLALRPSAAVDSARGYSPCTRDAARDAAPDDARDASASYASAAAAFAAWSRAS